MENDKKILAMYQLPCTKDCCECGRGGMADAYGLGPYTERYGGSSPSVRIKSFFELMLGLERQPRLPAEAVLSIRRIAVFIDNTFSAGGNATGLSEGGRTSDEAAKRLRE